VIGKRLARVMNDRLTVLDPARTPRHLATNRTCDGKAARDAALRAQVNRVESAHQLYSCPLQGCSPNACSPHS
jgi:hypothetical protein